MTSTPHTNSSSYWLSIFWPQTLHLMEIKLHNKHVRRSLLPFLGDTLSWLTGTANTKDVNSIKKRVNQLIAAQSMQQEAMVHIVSILNVTRYTAQVNRQHISIIMDEVDAATTGTLSPHILPITDLKQMLSHIEETLPTTMHLPVSFEDTLHFYRYLCTHVIIANRQFLLLTDFLQIRKTQRINIPLQIAPNVWILISAPSTVTTAITLICPGEPVKFITVKKPIHILHTASSLQCYIATLLSTSTIWTFRISCQHFCGHGKSQHGQNIIIRLLHMATLEGP